MIEFIEETHSYIVDGILTPSVTQLIHDIYMPNQYSGISPSVLKTAAEYGNRVHELIEHWNQTGSAPDWLKSRSFENIALNYYTSFVEIYGIESVSQEEPVAFYWEDNPLWAGKYDMIAKVNGKRSVVDIKTTSKYYPEYLSRQCTMYKMAIDQMTGEPIEDAWCIWLPKKGRKSMIHVDLLDGDQIVRDVRLYGKKHHAGRESLLFDGI